MTNCDLTSARDATRTWNVDVLVIGAGPAGLMAAQALARLGVNVKIIDRRHSGMQYGNADGLQPRTLEIWKSYAIFDRLVPSEINEMHGVVGYEQDKDGNLVRSAPSANVVVESRYPFEITASIDTIEATLRASLEDAGGRLSYSILPTSIDLAQIQDGLQDKSDYPVVLEHLHPTTSSGDHIENELVYAKYVIGADGAHSWVRNRCGITMDGDQTEYIWGVTDVTVDTDFPDCRFKCIIQSSTSAIIIIPREKGKIRIYVQLLPQDGWRTVDGRFDKSIVAAAISQAIILSRIKDGMKPYKFEYTQVFWSTIFYIPQRIASSYSFNNRVFIVGDACHTHSPKAGQGANASMGDSHNLAWKMAYVLRGWASKSLLDTYELERRTYAQDLIALDKYITGILSDGTAADYQSMLYEQNLFTSGVGICYRSRLTQSSVDLRANLKPGQRLPPADLVRLGDWKPIELQDLAPSDGLFKIFVFPGDIMQPGSDLSLIRFSEALDLSLCPDIAQKLSIYTILRTSKYKTQWIDVPRFLQCWERVFVSEGSSCAYEKFGIAPDGAVFLVRPDGYISIIAPVSDRGAHQVVTFIQEL